MIDLKALHLHWRVSHYKGTTYRSYSLAHSYRHNGTNRKDIVLKLGKLSDEEAGRWRALLQAAKTPHTFFTTLHDLTVTHRYAYLESPSPMPSGRRGNWTPFSAPRAREP